jgi:hypothetical protein
MLAEEQRTQFKAEVARLKLKGGPPRRDGLLQVIGGGLMAAGTIAVFVVYELSLSQKDPRNISSQQILATGFLALALVGAALFVAGSLARLLRLWLLRQLYESQAHVDQLEAAIRDR